MNCINLCEKEKTHAGLLLPKFCSTFAHQFHARMHKVRLILSFLLLVSVLPHTLAQRTNQVFWTYIDKYKDMAIDQMKRYRIPASITLAQGLLESDGGRSTLATKANNHFGIKVSGSWTGPYVLRNDDRPNEKFRKYRNAAESYEDQFLQGKRYQQLFTLHITDYRGWARGLKACGYATNPAYAESLIRVIEAYNLTQFDTKKAKTKTHTPFQTVAQAPKTEKSAVEVFYDHHQVLKNNGVYFIIVEIGDNMREISEATGVSIKRLYKYNDLPSNYTPTQGDIIYLAKKKAHASRELRHTPYHEFEPNQSIHDIAQLYGIRLDKLYKMNNWPKDHDAKVGDLIRIR